MLAIKLLYSFFNSLDVNIEEQAISGDFQPIIEKLDNLIHFLYVGHQTGEYVSNQQFDSYLRSLKFFFQWLIARYAKESNPALLNIVEAKFASSAVHLPSFFSEYKSLDDYSLQLIRDAILPTSGKNPFKTKNRLRNWLMIELLLQTGIRAGELLNLRAPNIYKDGDNYYLKVVQSSEHDINTDSRWNKPSIKNAYSIRTVAIPKLLFIGFEKYLASGRKKKSSRIKHGYIFTSERGSPLAQNSLSSTLRKVQHLLSVESNSFIMLSPHVLRHTFSERMLQFLLEVKGLDMERAKDELRNICGWSINSPMPNHYARKYIAMAANKHNLERINFSLNV